MSPPFRNKKHQETLWNALTAGICGIYPPTTPQGTDSLGDEIPAT